jgi:hypothetical protein
MQKGKLQIPRAAALVMTPVILWLSWAVIEERYPILKVSFF